jgi:hypothetical protein
MNAAELNEMHAKARECDHIRTIDHGYGKVECSDCGLFGQLHWDQLLSPDEEFVDSDETPMGMIIRRKGE